MSRQGAVLTIAFLAVAAGCAPALLPREPTPAEARLGAVLDTVAYGSRTEARAEGVTLVKRPSGAVVALPLPGRPTLSTRPPQDDTSLEAEIRGRMSTDPRIASVDVDIDVADRVVMLSGNVRSADRAARAIYLSLAAPGSRAVESRMTWVSEPELAKLKAADQRARAASGRRRDQ
jgi:hypothetical protein